MRCAAIILWEREVSTATVLDQEAELKDALAHLVRLVNTDIEGARAYVKLAAAHWPDSERIQHWARVLEPPRILARGPAKGGSFSPAEKAWLRAHAHEYPGCWLAIDEGRLIAANPDLGAARAAAAKDGAPAPLFHFTPSR